MFKEISASSFRQNQDEALEGIRSSADGIAIVENGKTIAGLIDPQMFARIRRMREQFAAGIGWGQAKKELCALINAEIGAARARYNELMTNAEHIEIVLKQGAEKARGEASALLSKVRRSVGIAPLS